MRFALLTMLLMVPMLSRSAPISPEGFSSSDFVKTVNSKYYSPWQAGLALFQCQAKMVSATLNGKSIKDSKSNWSPVERVQIMNFFRELHAVTTVDQRGGITVTTAPAVQLTGNSHIDAAKERMSSGLQTAARGFFVAWFQFTLPDLLNPSDKVEGFLNKDGIYSVKTSSSSGTVRESFDKDFKLIKEEMEIGSAGRIVKFAIKPGFQATRLGYVLSHTENIVSTEGKSLDIVMDIQNANVGGFILPTGVRFSSTGINLNETGALEFSDCRVEKQPFGTRTK